MVMAAEFIVRGTPISLQAKPKSKRRWKAVVQAAAHAGGTTLAAGDVHLSVAYYFDAAAAAIDVDNIIKPIADALVGLTYIDDGQMRSVCSERVDIRAGVTISAVSPLLISALGQPGDFVHVKVEP